jgi:hypothetical protein
MVPALEIIFTAVLAFYAIKLTYKGLKALGGWIKRKLK